MAAPISAALWALASGPLAAFATPGRQEVVAAAAALRDVQSRWAEFVAAGEVGVTAAGDALTDVLASSAEKRLEIIVPPGESLGVDIDGKSVIVVSKKNMGWALGDTIQEVNGEEVFNSEELKEKVQRAKDGKQPIRMTVLRVLQTPFVTINKSLRMIYEDTTANIPEVDEVMLRVANLKSKAGLMVDGIGDLPDIRKRMDLVIADLESFAAAPLLADAPRQQQKREESGSGYGELFG